MTNPARELADMLTGWKNIPPGKNVHMLRTTHTGDLDAWRTQAHAAALLGDVDRFLAAMKSSGQRVDHYLRFMPMWTAAVFVPDRAWGEMAGQAELPLFSQELIDMLYATGDLIDSTELAVPLAAPTRSASMDALDELDSILNSGEISMREPERRYIFELIASCRAVYRESEAFGSVDLLRRVHELLGVLTMLADSLGDDKESAKLAERIRTVARKVIPYASFGTRLAAGTLGAAADVIQITSGLH